ncbi:hypothetical protein W97_07617 [Coniosporium apollinis CBS 100218]|uniref:Nudix hydrolase domain-containing protein n=1 Tax=Coniosporium apollinis (strain CBS 100218) TaxID=1168221 RepID=R7Z2V5_CONA1|nr:uncharacterized protein W97_07617 [Coniosporium apollinis CBS 100218]EON68359.1 hypothetical protein W97_07617 [Coniosporium apollinis CBS 100218]
MSSFTLPNSSPECTVNLTKDLSKDQLLGFKPFTDWISTLQHSLSLQQNEDHTFNSSPYKLRSINIQSVDFFGGGDKIGFIKLKADVSNDDSEKLPGSVFLRGGSVGMMIVLQPDDVPENTETDKHVLLTLQPRIPAGSLSLAELPAGMLSDQGSFAGGAANEIREETGLEVSEDSLVNMSELALPPTGDSTGEKLQRATYPSAGGSDEFIPIFLHQRRVKRDTLKEWQGKLTGLRDHGEKITLKLVRLEELWREGGRDAKALVGWALYEGLRREGKI